jgi:F420-dependent oxidoreductase-like protein
MKLGLQVPSFTWPGGQAKLGETFGRIAQQAEQAGLYSLWVMDHFFQIGFVGKPEQEMLEGWSALAFAAGKTSKIKLGTMVTGITYRHPGILIKTATTLDVLSQGRAYVGLGAAWNEEEHMGLGVPYPPLAERFERLEEALQIAHQMWAGNEEPFIGKHYQLQRPLNSPQSIQKPHPPILIGGTGEKKTLRMVAQYGDACNLFYRLGDEAIKQKLDILQGHCAKLGRNYADIEKTSLDSFKLTKDGAGESVSPAQAIDLFGAQAALGFDQAIFSLHNVSDPAVFDLLATEVVPQVEKIAVAGR